MMQNPAISTQVPIKFLYNYSFAKKMVHLITVLVSWCSELLRKISHDELKLNQLMQCSSKSEAIKTIFKQIPTTFVQIASDYRTAKECIDDSNFSDVCVQCNFANRPFHHGNSTYQIAIFE